MIRIIGGGMGETRLSRSAGHFSNCDIIVCDPRYIVDINHPKIVQLTYRQIATYLIKHGMHSRIAYVVSGSPFFYSGATSIITTLKHHSIPYEVMPAISSKEYLIQKCALPEHDVCFTSLHGRCSLDLQNFMTKRFTFLLCDENTPKKLQKSLYYLPKHSYTLTLGSRLGFDDERIQTLTIDTLCHLDLDTITPFVLLIEKHDSHTSTITKDSDLLTQRGMYTKSYKRHLILQMLELQPNHTLWDMGAGSGSISLDAFKTYRVHTVLFEKNPERIPLIVHNLQKHSILSASLKKGDASEQFLHEESTPNRIFIGGGGEHIAHQFGALIQRLSDLGILVAVYVNLRHLAVAIQILDSLNVEYTVKSLSLTTYSKNLIMSEPERNIFLVKVIK
jgi:precorrin-6B C5,15-methyltransferase / cobalt-precorrin-6B C5,C15-methyltransferase